MTDIQAIYAVLLGRAYQEQLFSDLQGQKKQGQETLATCPFCGKEAHFSYSSSKPLWRCWVCQKSGDWIKYLEERNGLGFREALQSLAAAAGIEMEGWDQAKYQADIRRAGVLEAAQDFFIQELQAPEGKPVLGYLLQRGYSQEEIQAMGLGAYVDSLRLQAHLTGLGYSEQEIKSSGLLTTGFGSDYQLLLPWEDPAGRAIGLAARSLLPEDQRKARNLPKYKYSYGLEKDEGLIGLSSVRGSQAVLLVEGVLDALYLNSRGFKVVATGGATLSVQQIKALEASGVSEVLICLDTDEAGQRGTARAIQSLRASRLRPYVVDELQEAKDPDELVRGKGDQALKDALSLAKGWPAWLAEHAVSRHDTSTDRGLDQALEQALGVWTGIEDGIHKRAFLKALKVALGLDDEQLLLTRLEQAGQEASQRASREILNGLIRKAQEKAREGDVLGAEQEIQEGLQELRTSRGVREPEPYLLEDLLGDVGAISEGLRTGYPKLDELIRIPSGALTIVAGRPGHGKTTLLLNLLANLAEAYTGKRFYFFSYEEARSRLAVKLIMLMGKEEISPKFNLEAHIGYLRSRDGSRRKVEAAVARYEGLAASGAIWLQDSMLSVEDLARTIGALAKQGDVGAVLVDYIQKIPVQRPLQAQRYVELKLVSQLLLEQAVRTDIPIILGAQLGRSSGQDSKVRLDNLRESGDLEQDANLVLGLLNPSVERAEGEEPDPSPIAPLKVTVLKNRQGPQGLSHTLALHKSTLKISESEHAW